MTKLTSASFWLAGVQWFFFLFANTIMVPLTVGAAFGFSSELTASVVKVTFVVTGAASILQALIGHRYALMEGPAGLWWGLILSLAAAAPSMGMSLEQLGGALTVGILASGAATSLLGALGFARVLKKAFTQIVMFVYLFLLSCQLIAEFFRGMIGLEDGRMNLPVAALSGAVALLVGWIGVTGRGKLANFSILIGMTAGWAAYRLLFPGAVAESGSAGGGFVFELFPWGTPHFELGIMIAAMLAGLINMTNTIAALSTAEKLYDTVSTSSQYKRAFHLTGFHSVLAGLFGLVPYGPYTSSIGFLESTKILDRSALVLGGALFVTLGFVPAFGAFFASMPVSVGNAVLFVIYLQLFGSAFRNLQGFTFNPKTVYRIAAPALLGISILNVPAEAFAALPGMIRPIVGNGLLMGVLLAIVLELTVDWSRYEGRLPETGASVKR
ncbi:uracil/xanthine transporter [Paenibacillus sp. MBLB4367]|uniref:uracil/xanthine transporter n=1 Tax=Paenibacillus sp. MBLB4367 TaxID=3384767 RepID=UPI003908299A